jgi:hypothetical protein
MRPILLLLGFSSLTKLLCMPGEKPTHKKLEMVDIMNLIQTKRKI